jgi:NADH-quinone oxidoreductase subunit G
LLRSAAKGSVAIVASSRQTNEELFLLRKLATHLDALTDSIPRMGEGDTFLVHADKNPNSAGAGCSGSPMKNRAEPAAHRRGHPGRGCIRVLIVFGEDVTRHGIGANLLGRLDALIASDILPNATTALAHFLLPGCAHAEKRGTFINAKAGSSDSSKPSNRRATRGPSASFFRKLYPQ